MFEFGYNSHVACLGYLRCLLDQGRQVLAEFGHFQFAGAGQGYCFHPWYQGSGKRVVTRGRKWQSGKSAHQVGPKQNQTNHHQLNL